jgi:chromosome segregation ATPase
LSELAEQDILSRLTKLEQKMNNLDNNANALIDELESLQTVARELKIEDFVDKFNEYIEEVGIIKENLSCKISDEIENEQMKELVETRMKTVPLDIENLKNEYSNLRGNLADIRDEIRKSKSSNMG